MLVGGAMLRALRLELDHPGYVLKTGVRPVPSPDPKFSLRILDVRAHVGQASDRGPIEPPTIPFTSWSDLAGANRSADVPGRGDDSARRRSAGALLCRLERPRRMRESSEMAEEVGEVMEERLAELSRLAPASA